MNFGYNSQKIASITWREVLFLSSLNCKPPKFLSKLKIEISKRL